MKSMILESMSQEGDGRVEEREVEENKGMNKYSYEKDIKKKRWRPQEDSAVKQGEEIP